MRTQLLARQLAFCRSFTVTSISRNRPPYSSPGPPPLPPKEQQLIDDLIKAAARPAAATTVKGTDVTPPNQHRDFRPPPPPEFEGDVNPVTGEQGGPKREPLRHGDWSYSGRVSDF